MKVLVTGDREWSSPERVHAVLSMLPEKTIIVHGDCRGADITAAMIGDAMGHVTRAYPALWDKHGRSAGPIRNRQMLSEENLSHEPIDLVIAFHDDLLKSRGTRDMVTAAQKAGIPWVQCLSEDALNKWEEKEYSHGS